MIEVYFSKQKGVPSQPRRITGAWNCWVRVTNPAGYKTERLGSVEWVTSQKYSFNPVAHVLDSLLAKCTPAINKFIKDADRRVGLRLQLLRLEQQQAFFKRRLTTNHELLPECDVFLSRGYNNGCTVPYKGIGYAGYLMGCVQARKLKINKLHRRLKRAKEDAVAMTEAQKLAYQKNPNECPFCKSKDLDARMFNADGESAWRDVACCGCNREWRDVYTLTDVEEL